MLYLRYVVKEKEVGAGELVCFKKPMTKVKTK
jgi:hypothetical protein